jgi:hypothetical protein
LPRLKDLDGLNIRIFTPAAAFAFGRRIDALNRTLNDNVSAWRRFRAV